MTIAIASIQRNRNPYIIEWLAFHLAVGFDQFYIYAHKTTDGMAETLQRLSRKYPIQVFALDANDWPQIIAYNHAWTHFGNKEEWMAFIDGDEFLFPTKTDSIGEALAGYKDQKLSALGVYWKCYGSNGHIDEPTGMLLENYPRHSDDTFYANRHIKSIVKGGEQVVTNRSHLFETGNGTVDEHFRPITEGLMMDYRPTYDVFRINHYVTQSFEYFKKTKQNIGAADLPAGAQRSDEWFTRHDRNEEDDGMSRRFLEKTKEYMKAMLEFLKEDSPDEAGGITPIVRNYDLVAPIPEGDYKFGGDSIGLKEIVRFIPKDKTRHVTLLDIGFGLGTLGQIVKANDETRHWEIDGIDGYLTTCRNHALFEKKYYRNIWHGMASQIPAEQLRSYDIICLFDVIEHLDAPMAKQLLKQLLESLGENSVLAISTPLWFYPQDQQNEGDLEEHKIGVPATSLFSLQPTMYHIHPKFLVGTFVFTRESLKHIDAFAPTTDRSFDFSAGLKEVQRLGQKADGILYFVTPAKDTPKALPSTQQPSATVSKETIALFTIVYSPETQTRIVPGTEPLDNISNDRPDWREYWAIRRHLLQNSLEDDVYYGFLSPKFPTKTGMNGDDVRRFIRTHAEPLPDVFTFSPQADLGAFFLNTFEQGEAFDAGLMAAAKEIARQAGIADDLSGIVMDSRQTVFSNYFVANKRFWKRWFDVCEMIFAICEAGTTPLAEALNHPTTYPGAVPRKVFLIERIASLLLATEPWTVIPYSTFNCAWSGLPTANFRDEAITSDALKMAFNMTRDKNYLDAFSRLRNKVFYSNHTKDSDAGKPSSK